MVDISVSCSVSCMFYATSFVFITFFITSNKRFFYVHGKSHLLVVANILIMYQIFWWVEVKSNLARFEQQQSWIWSDFQTFLAPHPASLSSEGCRTQPGRLWISISCKFYPWPLTLEDFRILWLSCFSEGASKSTLDTTALKILHKYQEFHLWHFSGSARLPLSVATCKGLVILLPPGLDPVMVIKC